MLSGKRNRIVRLKTIIKILESRYGIPKKNGFREPLDETIFTILSQNTNDRNRDRAWTEIKKEYRGWTDVLDGGAERLKNTIRVAGLAEQKSRNIINILSELEQKYHALTLKFLSRYSNEDARKFLLSFRGIGEKTAACVMLFSLGKPAFPVDTHIFRVAKRLGLFPAKSTREKAHYLMEAIVPEKKYHSFHINLIKHGRMTCHPRSPECAICPVRKYCEFFNSRNSKKG